MIYRIYLLQEVVDKIMNIQPDIMIQATGDG
jgi:hypothetical protein